MFVDNDNVENIKAMKTLGLTQPKEEGVVMTPCPVSSANKLKLPDSSLDKRDVGTSEDVEHEAMERSVSDDADTSHKKPVDSNLEKINGFSNGLIKPQKVCSESSYLKRSHMEPEESSASSLSVLSVTDFPSQDINSVENKSLDSKNLSKSLSPRSNKTIKRPSLECLVARLHNRVDKLNSNKEESMSVIEESSLDLNSLVNCKGPPPSISVDSESKVLVQNSHSPTCSSTSSCPSSTVHLYNKDINSTSKETCSTVAQECLKSIQIKDDSDSLNFNGEKCCQKENSLSNFDCKKLHSSSSNLHILSVDEVSAFKNKIGEPLEEKVASETERESSSFGEKAFNLIHTDKYENKIVINKIEKRTTTTSSHLTTLLSVNSKSNADESNSLKYNVLETESEESSKNVLDTKLRKTFERKLSSSSSSPPLFSDTPSSDASQSEMMVKISDAVEAILSLNSKESRSESAAHKPKDNFDILFSNSNSPVDSLQNNINFSCAFKILDLLPEKNTESFLKMNCNLTHSKSTSSRIQNESVENDGKILQEANNNNNSMDSINLEEDKLTSSLSEDDETERMSVMHLNNILKETTDSSDCLNKNVSQSVLESEEQISKFDINSELNISLAKTKMCSGEKENSVAISLEKSKLICENNKILSKPEICESLGSGDIHNVQSTLKKIVDSVSFFEQKESNNSENTQHLKPSDMKYEDASLSSDFSEKGKNNVHNNNYSSSCNSDFLCKKYINFILNRECNYYSSDLRRKRTNFDFCKKLNCIDSTEETVNNAKRAISNIAPKGTEIDKDLKRKEGDKILTFTKGTLIEVDSSLPSMHDNSMFHTSKDIIGKDDIEIKNFSEINDSSDLEIEPVNFDVHISSENYLDINLTKEKISVSDNCILCNTFYDDLMLHCAASHGCITYIPIYQTNSFIHYTSERTGDVSNPYSDSLYENPNYICKCCGIFIKTMDAVRLHMNTHKDLFMIQSPNSCFCNKKTFSYPQHKFKVLLFQSSFICSFCGCIFSCKKGLNLHLKIVHFSKNVCSKCGKKDVEKNNCMMEHNANHLTKGNLEARLESDDNVDQIWDQTHYSWNSLDNHLNYFDGKHYRLKEVSLQNKSDNIRENLTLPMSVDPHFAVLPQNLFISPTFGMVKYMKMKLDSKLTNCEINPKSLNELDMNILRMLRKRFSVKNRRRKKSPSNIKIRKKIPLPLCLELKKPQLKKKKCDAEEIKEENLRTRRKYIRKAKTKVQNKGKVQKGDGCENIILSRTRSGMRAKDEEDIIKEEEDCPMTSGNEISGEWIIDHTFVCCSCGAAFLDLAEVMDHKWESHPGVWCAHTMIQGQNRVPKIFCEQYLPPNSRERNKKTSSKKSKPKDKHVQERKSFSCTNCKLKFGDKEEFHFHVIDCGGINQIASSKKKCKKRLRFKRRKGQGVSSRRYSNNGGNSSSNNSHSTQTALHKGPNGKENGFGTSNQDKRRSSETLETSNSVDVKRNSKLCIRKFGNGQVKNRLKNILLRRKKKEEIVQISRKQNLRQLRVRKKEIEEEVRSNGRITRNSKLLLKEKKSDIPQNDKIRKLPRTSSVLLNNKKLKQETNVKTNKKDTKISEKLEIDNENYESNIETKITSSNVVQNTFSKLIPLTKKLMSKSSLRGKTKKSISMDNKSSLSKKNQKTLGVIEQLHSRISKQKRNLKSDADSDKKLALRPRVSRSFSSDFNSQKIQSNNEDSDSASEPEVIRNFREKRVFGRVGLRSEKSHKLRYSLRPSVNSSSNTKEEKTIEDDEEEELVLKPCKGLKRKYNIGDDDEIIEPTFQKKEFSVTQDKSNSSNAINSKRRKSLSASRDLEAQSVIKEKEALTEVKSCRVVSRRKSFPPFKNPNSRVSRFYYMAHKKFSRLKLCQNANSESSNLEESCPKKKVRSLSTDDSISTLKSEPNLTVNKSSSLLMPNNLKLNSLRMNKMKNNQDKKCSKNVHKKSSGKSLKPATNKKHRILTPKIVDSDSESLSDVPLIECKRDKLLNLVSSASIESSKVNSNDSTDRSTSHEALLANVPVTQVSHKIIPECKKRKLEEQENSKKRYKKSEDSDLEPLSNVPFSIIKCSIRNKTKKKNNISRRKTSRNIEPRMSHVNNDTATNSIPDKACEKLQALNKRKFPSRNSRKKQTKSTEVSCTENSSALVNNSEIQVSDKAETQSCGSKEIKVLNIREVKIKPKRKYSVKTKRVSANKDDESIIRNKMKKSIKEVRVLSYKSLNTKEGVLPPANDKTGEGENEEELKKELKKKTRKSYTKRGRKKMDENSPAVTEMKNQYPLEDVQSENEDGVGFLCTDCGLSFDSALSREDHRQDCRNIAFEMSLMAEDYLYECPYCQLTFALKGTQRKHISSCRIKRSRKNGQRKKKANNSRESKKKSSYATITSSKLDDPSPEVIPSEKASSEGDREIQSSLKSDLIGNRLASHCQEQTGVTEICSLLLKYNLCTNELRCLLNSSSSTNDARHTVIRLHGESSFSSYSQGGLSHKVLENLMSGSKALLDWLSRPLENVTSEESLEKDKDLATEISVSRPDLFKALSQVEDTLKKAEDLDSIHKKEKMLNSMKHMFQSDTGS